MIMEIIADAVQTVNAGQNVYFTNTVICGNCNIIHRAGSGLVTLRGLTDQCRARYRVTFTGNIAIPTGETVGPIQLAIALNGEAIPATTMIATPAAVDNYFNIHGDTFIEVPRGCCVSVSIKNTSTIAVNVQNANLTAIRTA